MLEAKARRMKEKIANGEARAEEKAKKTCPCTICGKVFQHRSGLAYHLKTHSDEKPYSCPVCAKLFKSEKGTLLLGGQSVFSNISSYIK